MKLLVFILRLNFLPNVYWVEELKGIVSTIDKKAKETKNRTVVMGSDNYGSVNKQFQYKLKPYKKTVEIFKTNSKFDLSGTQNFYCKKTFVFCAKFFMFKPGWSKYNSTCSGNEYMGELIETNQFFKNDSLGVKYSRKMEVCLNQNLDSLKNELQKIAFDVEPLNHQDYLKLVDDYNAAKYGINRPDKEFKN